MRRNRYILIIIYIVLIIFFEVLIDYQLVLIDLEKRVCFHNLIPDFQFILNAFIKDGVEGGYEALYDSYYTYLQNSILFNSLPKEELSDHLLTSYYQFKQYHHDLYSRYTLYLSKYLFVYIEYLLSLCSYDIYTFKEMFNIHIFYSIRNKLILLLLILILLQYIIRLFKDRRS